MKPNDPIILRPAQISSFLGWGVLMLLLLHVFALFIRGYAGTENAALNSLANFFDLDREGNLPTLFSSVILLIASALLFFVSFQSRRAGYKYLYWAFLGFIFLFLALDENCLIHEKTMPIVSGYLGSDRPSYFRYAWVIPYGGALLILLLLSVKFLLSLPRKIMWLFMLSGAVYILGALVLEMAEGVNKTLYGKNLTQTLIVTFQELFELIGVVLFIHSLFLYIGMFFSERTVQISLVKVPQNINDDSLIAASDVIRPSVIPGAEGNTPL